jgi:hypothetical protein
MRWHRGGCRCEGPSSFAMVVDFDHCVFFESSRDVKAGMDGKDMPSRYKQAQEYLKKAKETHHDIMVRRRCMIRARWNTEFTSLSRSNLP